MVYKLELNSIKDGGVIRDPSFDNLSEEEITDELTKAGDFICDRLEEDKHFQGMGLRLSGNNHSIIFVDENELYNLRYDKEALDKQQEKKPCIIITPTESKYLPPLKEILRKS